MRCPGQDMRYWKDDAAFEVPCPKCGSPVEFFKDESSARCSKCGHRFRNPQTDVECAKWCTFAEKCLGFVPERDLTLHLGEGALARTLIEAVKTEFESEPSQIARALVIFQHAKELVRKSGGDPPVTLAAALLLDVARKSAAAPSGATGDGTARVRQILEKIPLEEDVVQRACGIVDHCLTGTELDSVEFYVVSDSHRLADLVAAKHAGQLDNVEPIIEDELKTAAAKERARSLFC